MSLPKEPRQKMINLMYLVLTALLALNVSSEILNAFKTVKNSLDVSTGIASNKTSQLFQSFKKKMEDPSSREQAVIWNAKAEEARKFADQAYKFVDDLKIELIAESTPKGDTTYVIDDLNAATRLLVEPAPSGKGKGKELLASLENFKKQILGIDSSITKEIGNSLPVDTRVPATASVGNKDWSAAYFRMTPTIAALTILSKFQNDIRNTEAQVVELCHKKIGEVIFTYDQFKVIANASSSYMMPGDEFTINAGIGAFSSQAQPSISIGGQGATLTPEGDYEVKTKAESNPGNYTKMVNVTYRDQKTGEMKTVNKEIKYTVGAPAGLTVSTDATRVFYAGGIENPMSVTGSGGSEQIQLSIDGVGINKIDKGRGQFLITCSQPGTAIVRVTDLKSKATQEFKIPIKRVPSPVAMVNGKQGGDMTASQFKAAGGVSSKLVDFIFEGYSFKVVSFAMFFIGTGFEEKNEVVEVTGNAFNSEARKFMNRCSAGTTVVIGAIRVADQIGNVRDLEGNITFVLE